MYPKYVFVYTTNCISLQADVYYAHIKINVYKRMLFVPRSMRNTRRVHYRAVSQLIATTFSSLIEAYYETFFIDTNVV